MMRLSVSHYLVQLPILQLLSMRRQLEHGVTADANNAVTLTFDFAAQPSSNGAFKLNGQAVDLTTATSAAYQL